jgi:ferredoxin
MVETYEVEFVGKGRTIQVPEDQPILEAAEQVGIDLPYQCRMGVCGVCSALRVEKGRTDQIEAMFLSGSEKDEGYTLTCVAKPRSDLKLRSNESP